MKTFEENPDLQVLNGRWGPYIAYGKANVKIPKGTDAAALSFQDCMKLCEEQGADPEKKAARTTSRKTTSSSQTPEKQTAKKTSAKSVKANATTTKK